MSKTKKDTYNTQFKGGYFPQERADESTRVNGREPDSPSKQRKRMGVALGAQMQANPGMAGKNDYSRKGR